MNNSTIILLYLLIFISKTLSQNCIFNPRTYLKTGKLAELYLESNSKICEESKPKLNELKTCSNNILDVEFSSTAIIPKTANIWPYIDLNITIISNVYIKDIFVQLECLYATNLENTYCYNHTVQIQKWGRMIWPCRQHIIKEENLNDVKLPIIFEHACFRMHGLSQYRINITLLPQNCQLSYIITLPMDKQLEPKIAHFLNADKDDNLSNYPWSPMISIDLNNPYGLDIKFARMRNISNIDDVTITVYQMLSDVTSKQVFNQVLSSPKSLVTVNIPKGNYIVFVYVDHPNCKLHCSDDNNENEHKKCNICPHTYMNFTLYENKLYGLQNFWYSFLDIVKYIFYFIFVVIVLAIIVVFCLYVYVHIIRPRRLSRLPPQNIEMTLRPDILILYTDDCQEHTTTVTALAELLQKNANAKIRIDVFDLNDPSIKPSMWLLNSITQSQYVLIIFNDASKKVMSGDILISKRPFPEMFNSAVSMIIAEINEITSREGISSNEREKSERRPNRSSDLSKFIVSRFNYSNSSSIPEFFKFLPCKPLILPNDLGLLLGYIHGVDITNSTTLEHDADVTGINQSIIRYQQFVFNNPNWLNSRFEQKSLENSSTPVQADNLPLLNQDSEESIQEIAKKYDLIVPENDSDIEANMPNEEFKLIHNVEDVSSLSSTEFS